MTVLRRIGGVTVALVSIIPACSEDDTPGGAERLAGEGDTAPGDYVSSSPEEKSLEELDLEDVRWLELREDPTDGYWIFAEGDAEYPYAAVHVTDDKMDSAQDLFTPWVENTVAVGPKGEMALNGVDPLSLAVIEPGEDQTANSPARSLRDEGAVGEAGATAFLDDGTVLVGYQDGRIEAFPVRGDPKLLLGAADQAGAQVHVDELPSKIRSLAHLPDGRIAFSIRADAREWSDATPDDQLFVLSETDLQPLDIGLPADREITAMVSAPEGKLLAVSRAPGAEPWLVLIDPKSKKHEVVAKLDGVNDPEAESGDPEAPLSAIPHGDDVVFYADHHLWRLKNVLD